MKKSIAVILTMAITALLLLPAYAEDNIWDVDVLNDEDIWAEDIWNVETSEGDLWIDPEQQSLSAGETDGGSNEAWKDVYYDFIMNGRYLQETDIFLDGFSQGVRFALWDMSNPNDHIPELIVDNNAQSMPSLYNIVYTVIDGQLVRAGNTYPRIIAERKGEEPEASGIFTYSNFMNNGLYIYYSVDESGTLIPLQIRSSIGGTDVIDNERLCDVYENHSSSLDYYFKEQIDAMGWDDFCALYANEPNSSDGNREDVYLNDYEYTISETGVIGRYMGHDAHVVIPDMINGVRVTGIGEGVFMMNDTLQSVVIADGVTVIGDRAFNGCRKLTAVTIPDSVTDIGNSAFEGCESIPDIQLPDGLLRIGDRAFAGAFLIETLSIPDHLESIGDLAFDSCPVLQSIVIPDTVSHIGSNPFRECDEVVITISSDHPYFELIDGVLFGKSDHRLISYPNEGPAKYVIPQGTETIGDYAFYDNDGFTEIVFPESLTQIGRSAFFRCESLLEIVIPDGVTTIEDGAFEDCESIEHVEIPSSVTSIGGWAFAGCEALEDLNLPAEVTEIGSDVFLNCLNLTVSVDHNTLGEQYCIANEVPYMYPGEEAAEQKIADLSANSPKGPLQGMYNTDKLTLVFSGFRFSGENEVTFYCGGFENSHGYYTENGSRYELTITDYDQGSHYAPQVRELMNNCRITVRKIDDSSIGVEIEDQYGGLSFWQIGEEIYRK